MTIEVACQFCNTTMRLKDEAAGRKFKCRGCREELQAPTQAVRRTRNNQSSSRKEPTSPAIRRKASSPNRRKRQPEVESESYEFDFDESEYEDYDTAPTRRRPSSKSKPKKQRTARKENPRAFQEFDKIVNEVAIFYVGFAVLIAGLGAVIYFIDKNPDDPARHQTFFQGMMTAACALFVMGILPLSRSTVVLQIMRPFNFLLAAATGFAALAATALIGFQAILVWILPIAFVTASGRIKNAVKSYPKN